MISRERLAKLCQWFKRKSFVKCCGIAPVILLSALLVFNCDFGCNVIVDGKIVGTAPSEKYVCNLIDSINEELAPYLGGSDAITFEPTMTPKIVIGKGFSTSQELGEALKEYCPYLEKAYSVKSNDKTVVAFKTKDERKIAYDKFISDMTKDYSSYEILDDVSFEHELVPYGLIKSGDSAVAMLERSYDFSEKVTIDADCSIENILHAYGMTKAEFTKLNPNYESGKSTEVQISSRIPYIRVACTQDYVENTIIKHTVKYESDDSMAQGKTVLKTEGKDGLKQTQKTKYVLNGKSLFEKTGDVTYTDSVTAVLMIGTREKLKGTGVIEQPCDGTLSSRYGARGGRMHKGIDICDAVGTPITAADSGKVVFSGWDDSGYGNMVKIDHGNGYMTLYAHCDELYVAQGEEVEKGDVISTMGNTGRSTGPHLHFEVINTKTGGNVDPLSIFDLKQK